MTGIVRKYQGIAPRLGRGVYLAPSAFEAAFMSAAHSDADIDETLDRLDGAMEESGA